MSEHFKEEAFTRIWCELVTFRDEKLPTNVYRGSGSLTVVAYYGNSWLIFSASVREPVRAGFDEVGKELDRELTVQEMPLHDALRFVVNQAEAWKNHAGELLGGKT